MQDAEPLGIKMYLRIPMGMSTRGLTLATQVCRRTITVIQDDDPRPFDSARGLELRKARLPVGGQSSPLTYVSPMHCRSGSSRAQPRARRFA